MHRSDTLLLGKIIGTSNGWDQIDTWNILFMELIRNELGQQFVPDFKDGSDLALNFETGVVSIYNSDGEETILKANWANFTPS